MILRLPFLSLHFSQRAASVGSGLFLALLIAFVASVQLGAFPLSLQQTWSTFSGNSEGVQRMIVIEHRLPRILTAIGAGAAFGMAGSMFQTMLRNPLASPDVIGFNAGASCGALLAMALTGDFVLPGAMTGGIITAIAVSALAWNNGLHPYRLILIGIGASLTLMACADVLMTKLDALTAAEMAKWLVGTLNTRDWDDVFLVWTGLALLTPLVIWLQFPLSRICMADDIATGLGLTLSPMRMLITATAVALVALAVSVAGPLPFVAFVSGPIARRLVRGGSPAVLHSAVVGAIVTLLADIAARSVPIAQLPAGVFTAIIGAPVLMWLLLVQFRKGTL
ncbi:iron complex transport system permease protein [Ruegeria halocynthiae]|uniref:Iron complex transport system permease protein n=1 Tax=Ruegeria halocynthiae TaxID=985054 RepID=A0A1H2XZE4_9RHOB|nr:iron chelate uptake ABC transporter family permease subunit [Ruegeria halocynthiae]SDW97794.1 iron complex transport system permease protein [Ruegeria halocynthiae]